MKLILPCVLSVLLFVQANAFAIGSEVPTLPNHLTCLTNERETLPYINEKVMDWKYNTPDQTIKRAMIFGKITQILPSKSNHGRTHSHFAIDLDNKPGGDIEVIYNDEFGSLPRLQVGMMVVACGDYITVGPRARLPSPLGAIIHWVHFNPGNRDGGKHPGGFLVIEGKPYGFVDPHN